MAEDPAELGAYTGLARVLARAGEPQRGLEILLPTAEAFLDAELTGPADELLATALGIAPDSAEAHALAGRSAVLVREFARGTESLERSLELGGADPRTRLYLGAALWEIGETERSEAVYRQALATAGPGRGAFLPLHQLGRLLLWQGRSAEAVEPLERAVRLAPEAADTRLALARALSEAGRGEEALAAYRQAVVLDPDSFHAHWGLAQELLRAAREGDDGARAEAAEVLEVYRQLYRADQVRTRETGLQDARLAEAGLALAQGDEAGAAEAARLYASLGDSPEALAGLARARARLGDREAAVAALERAVALAPERRDLALMLADQRLALERGDGAGGAEEQGAEVPEEP